MADTDSRLSSTFRFVKSQVVTLPPILSIQEISFSESVLDAEETAEISIRIKNVGPGPANDLTIELSGSLQGLTFPRKTSVPTITQDGGEQTVKIKIVGEHELSTATATIDIKVIEPHFKQKIRGKRLSFPTRKFRNPELILAQFAVLESRSANPNNQINLNEMIDLKFYVQNVGQGDAERVEVNVETNQIGVLWLGVAADTGLARKHPTFSKIAAGKPKLITYSYLVNSEFTEKELQFKITATENYGEYGFSETKSVAINTKLVAEGKIRQVEIDDERLEGRVVIEELPELKIDVDKNISPVFITVDNPLITLPNATLFTSATGEQVSCWYPDKKHSLFTYFFLKGLQGAADVNNDKQVAISELEQYVTDKTEGVPYYARRLHSRTQTPVVSGDKKRVIVQFQ